MAESTGGIDENFDSRLTELAAQSAASSKATLGLQGREWMWPEELATAGPHSIEAITQAFDREDLNTRYKQIIEESGGAGTAGSAKTQIDELAAMERAFRMRHLSSIRGFMMGAARRRGHGHPQGVFNAIRNNAVDLNQTGGAN